MKAIAPWKGSEILAPITFNPASEYAVDVAIDMAKATGSGVALMHVADSRYGEGFLEAQHREASRAQSVEAASERLNQIIDAKRAANVPIRGVVKAGLPAYEILRVAETEKMKAIILARKPRNIVSRMLLGTVSRDIIDCSTCPVLVINYNGRSESA